jgi:dCMP deaminase
MKKTQRISKPNYFMAMAQVVQMRSTCIRRNVGCVLVDNYDNVMSTGYNGVARGMAHCIDKPCPGARSKSGQGLDLCEAIHAEQNALLQCKDVTKIKDCFTTTAPCIHCIKLLMNTCCSNIYYLNPYGDMDRISGLWLGSSPFRKMIMLPLTYTVQELK